MFYLKVLTLINLTGFRSDECGHVFVKRQKYDKFKSNYIQTVARSGGDLLRFGPGTHKRVQVPFIELKVLYEMNNMSTIWKPCCCRMLCKDFLMGSYTSMVVSNSYIKFSEAMV